MNAIGLSNVLNNATVGAVFGAVAGAITGSLATLGLNWWSRRQLSRKLSFEPQQKRGHRACAQIYNGHNIPLNSVCAYITIEHELSDILEPPQPWDAFVKPECRSKVQKEQLCWSFAGNPACIDIYPEDHQGLDIVEITPD